MSLTKLATSILQNVWVYMCISVLSLNFRLTLVPHFYKNYLFISIKLIFYKHKILNLFNKNLDETLKMLRADRINVSDKNWHSA